MKYIKKYVGLYSITEGGIVISHRKEIALKPIKQMNGYLTVTLYNKSGPRVVSIHRLVAEAYLDNPENKRTVNHLDMNKHNNHVSNLEWATYKENHTHAIANGVRIGEKNGNSKLTEDDILEIRGKYKFRKYTYAMLSNDYKVGKVYIGRIINRKVWKHI